MFIYYSSAQQLGSWRKEINGIKTNRNLRHSPYSHSVCTTVTRKIYYNLKWLQISIFKIYIWVPCLHNCNDLNHLQEPQINTVLSYPSSAAIFYSLEWHIGHTSWSIGTVQRHSPLSN